MTAIEMLRRNQDSRLLRSQEDFTAIHIGASCTPVAFLSRVATVLASRRN